MLVTIAKTFRFEAAHHLPKMPKGHKCRNLHGHSYAVDVELCGIPDPDDGILVDYAEIEQVFNEYIHGELDHRCLNEVKGLENPTTEVLAPWIAERMARGFERLLYTGDHPDIPRYLRTEDSSLGRVTLLHAVTVRESVTTWCRVDAYHLANAGRCATPASM